MVHLPSLCCHATEACCPTKDHFFCAGCLSGAHDYYQWDGLPGYDLGAHVEHQNEANVTPRGSSGPAGRAGVAFGIVVASFWCSNWAQRSTLGSPSHCHRGHGSQTLTLLYDALSFTIAPL